jgi:dienelactone hydrolase
MTAAEKVTAGPMAGYDKAPFTSPLGSRKGWYTCDVYRTGDGPPVVIMQELPGIGPQTLRLAERLREGGFSVWIPHLFGPLGEVATGGNVIRLFCMRREFALFAAGETSPITAWLAALCAHAKSETGAKGVGTIGMCLTGNFAISLMAADAVLAGVASQPSMPLMNTPALHMSEEDVATVRTSLDEKGAMLAYRFEGDAICRAGKFDAIGNAFNDDRERIRLKTLPGPGHSVLTLHFVDEAGHPTRAALDEIIGYFQDRLC